MGGHVLLWVAMFWPCSDVLALEDACRRQANEAPEHRGTYVIGLSERSQQPGTFKGDGYSDALWITLMNNGIKSIFIIAALAIGLAMPGLLFYRRKSVV